MIRTATANRTSVFGPRGRGQLNAHETSRQRLRAPELYRENETGSGRSTWASHRFGNLLAGEPPVRAVGASAAERIRACPLASGPRVCPFGGACHVCPTSIQTKLSVGSVNDPFEREAERVADLVMKAPRADSEITPPSERLGALKPQRQPEEEEEEEELLQPSPMSGARTGPSPQAVSRAQGLARRSGGQPLPSAVQGYMSARLGFDFGGVRIHANREAAEWARGIGARAYTIRDNVVFNQGEYSPHTAPGLRLLAHELTHVVQQNAAPPVAGRHQRLPMPSGRTRFA